MLIFLFLGEEKDKYLDVFIINMAKTHATITIDDKLWVLFGGVTDNKSKEIERYIDQVVHSRHVQNPRVLQIQKQIKGLKEELNQLQLNDKEQDLAELKKEIKKFLVVHRSAPGTWMKDPKTGAKATPDPALRWTCPHDRQIELTARAAALGTTVLDLYGEVEKDEAQEHSKT